jgi:formylglycine-generating enzyme required for sulfatase activity
MKRRIFHLPLLKLLIGLLLIHLNSCEVPVDLTLLPIVATTEVTNITETTAQSGGYITSDAGNDITVRGVCWSLKPNPTTRDSITKDAAGTGRFTSRISNLLSNTTYYARAYATNKKGTAYGLQETFTTKSKLISTTAVSSITTNAAASGGNITIAVGNESIIARGVCWSTSPTPTIIDNKTSDGSGIGTFTSSMTGLNQNTKYYVRAYAVSSIEIFYGNEVTFTTLTENVVTVNIPAGTFTMGSPANEVNRNSNETQHQVTLSAFRMSKYEITNEQYAEFLNFYDIKSNGKYTAGIYPTQTLIFSNTSWGLLYSGGKWVPVAGYEEHPVINVTWYGASEYATYVNGRLPTEAEWEYACRAGTATPFFTGSCLDNTQSNYNWAFPYNNCTNAITSSPAKPQAVGTYPANVWGLHDMHGNVTEWCNDWYDTYSTSAQTNPTGPSTGTNRIIRGGSWYLNALYCRSAIRHQNLPEYYHSTNGFRVVFTP